MVHLYAEDGSGVVVAARLLAEAWLLAGAVWQLYITVESVCTSPTLPIMS